MAALERQGSAAFLLLPGDRQAEVLFDRARVGFLGWLDRARDNAACQWRPESAFELALRVMEVGGDGRVGQDLGGG
jgi:hypothetical protein